MHEVLLPFENKSDISKDTGSLPFMAGVVIDADDDGSEEVFLGGGRGQPTACCGTVRSLVSLWTSARKVNCLKQVLN